jgi:hypothetical protein
MRDGIVKDACGRIVDEDHRGAEISRDGQAWELDSLRGKPVLDELNGVAWIILACNGLAKASGHTGIVRLAGRRAARDAVTDRRGDDEAAQLVLLHHGGGASLGGRNWAWLEGGALD